MKDLVKTLGKVCAVIGAQWGDEGKGKLVDILSGQYDVIARACGGANAGHTIVVGDKKYVFHLIPSGALHDGKEIVIGSGMVLHLRTLLDEIKVLEDAGIDIIGRLHISGSAHILFNFHKQVDEAQEISREKSSGKGIGTTKRGIGPAYEDKAARTGIRMESLGRNLSLELSAMSDELRRVYGISIDTEKELSDLAEANKKFGDRIFDTPALMQKYLLSGKSILIEGAQGAHLDIDHGTYPHVTSSSTTVSGALQGLGISPFTLSSVIGIAKAYCTRVGAGEFLSEADEKTASRLRERGGEYGATTGRPRRCGWMSIPDLQKSASINGIGHWNITKLDVLDGEETIRIETGADSKAKYHELPGWKTSTKGFMTFDDLPENARNFINFVEERTGIPATFIGTGPSREEMIIRL